MRSTSITRFPSITQADGLTKEQLKSFPSIFATDAHPKMSDRYTFLSTAEIIEPLLKEGYVCTHVSQRATHAGHRDPRFTRHLVRLRRKSEKPAVGDVYPEVVLGNSHDGQSRLHLHGGLLRLACLNGMTVSVVGFKGISVFHRGALEPILEQIRAAVDSASSVISIVEKMAAKKLSATTQKTLARKAAELVYDTVDFDTSPLLASRRADDEGDSLWLVFNRIQENLMRGGVSIQHETGQHRSAITRGITHIRRSIDINLDLWQLATKLA